MIGIFTLLMALLLGYQVSQFFKTYDFRYMWSIGIVTFLLMVLITAASQSPQYYPVGQ